MSTAIQPNDERPIRNGVRPAAYNYVLAGIATGLSFIGMGILYIMFSVVVMALALVIDLFLVPLSFLIWCCLTFAQARRIVATPVGEAIPSQHGFGCLGKIVLRVSATANAALWVTSRPTPELWFDRCPAGCKSQYNCWH